MGSWPNTLQSDAGYRPESFMPFLSPWMLWGLATLAVPVILHLWRRRRVAVMPFSTLRFLKLAHARSSRSAHIENILILLLRCLIVLLLVLAASRPVITAGTTRWFGGEVPRSVVLAIDNSMSMNFNAGEKTRLEESKAMALTVLESLTPGDSVAVMEIGRHAGLLVAELTLDHAMARKMIEGIKPGEEGSDFSAAFLEAKRIFSDVAAGLGELYFFTDNQESAWHFEQKKPSGPDGMKYDARTVIVRPDDRDAPNAAIRDVLIKTPSVTEGATVEGSAVVMNFSGAMLHNVLDVKINGERLFQREIEVAPSSSAEISFQFQTPRTSEHWMKGVASISEDNLPDDDRRYFVLPVYQPPRVLIVEGRQEGVERLHSGYYLGKALSFRDAGVPPPKMISVPDLGEADLKSYSVIFLADTGDLGREALLNINRFLETGGMVVLTGGEFTTPESLSGMNFLPWKPRKIITLPPGRLATKILNSSHPLFAGAWDVDTPFPALPQSKIIDWSDGGRETIASFSNNKPFLILGDKGRGCVLLINASADRSWGDFPLSPSFLPLMQQITRYSSEREGLQKPLIVGDFLPITPGFRDATLSVRDPKGMIRNFSADAMQDPSFRTEAPGFYEIKNDQQKSSRVVAVNTDPKESNLHPADPGSVARILRAEFVSGWDNLKFWLDQRRDNTPLWPLLLTLALMAFLTEEILSNVMAGRRSQNEGKQIRTGRLNSRMAGHSFHHSATGKTV